MKDMHAIDATQAGIEYLTRKVKDGKRPWWRNRDRPQRKLCQWIHHEKNDSWLDCTWRRSPGSLLKPSPHSRTQGYSLSLVNGRIAYDKISRYHVPVNLLTCAASAKKFGEAAGDTVVETPVTGH
jgi:hypothetical protein